MELDEMIGKCRKCGSSNIKNDGISVYCGDCNTTLEVLDKEEEDNNGESPKE